HRDLHAAGQRLSALVRRHKQTPAMQRASSMKGGLLGIRLVGRKLVLNDTAFLQSLKVGKNAFELLRRDTGEIKISGQHLRQSLPCGQSAGAPLTVLLAGTPF